MKFLSILFAIAIALPSTAAETISLYTWRTQEAALWQAINNQKLIPGVKVELKVISYDSFPAFIHLGLQQNAVELFQWAPGAAELKPLIERGAITPFSGDLSPLNRSALLAALGPDNQYYGVPFALQLQALIGNKKVIAKTTNAEQPTSLSELEQRFAALKSAGITPIHLAGKADWYVSQLLAEVLLAGLVDSTFTQGLVDGSQCFTDTQYTQMFSQLLAWNKQGYFNSNLLDEDYVSLNTAVGVGQSAFAVEGGWKAGKESSFYAMDPNYEFAFWYLPGAGKSVYALGDGSYQVNAQSPKRALADKVLAFTATKQFAELFALHVNELPAWGGQLNIAQPTLRTMAELVAKHAYTASPFSAYSLNRGTPSYQSLVRDALRQLLAEKITPQQAGVYIQRGLNSWNYAGANQCTL